MTSTDVQDFKFYSEEYERIVNTVETVLRGKILPSIFPSQEINLIELVRNGGTRGTMSYQFKLTIEVDGLEKNLFVKIPGFIRPSAHYGEQQAFEAIKPQIDSLSHEAKIGEYLYSKDESLFSGPYRILKPLKFFEESENSNTYAVLVLDYLENRSLDTYIEDNYKVPNKKLLGTMSDLSILLDKLAKLGVHHMDLKPENVMCSENFNELELIDISSIYMEEDKSTDPAIRGFVEGGWTTNKSPLPIPSQGKITEDFVRHVKNNYALMLLQSVFGRDVNPYNWGEGRFLMSLSNPNAYQYYTLDLSKYPRIGPNVQLWIFQYLGYIEMDQIMNLKYNDIFKSFEEALEADTLIN